MIEKVFYTLGVIILIFIICSLFLGIDLSQKFYDVKNKITDKNIETETSCLDIRNKVTKIYGSPMSSALSFEIDKVCDNSCANNFGEDYESRHSKRDKCLERNNLSCVCYIPSYNK